MFTMRHHRMSQPGDNIREFSVTWPAHSSNCVSSNCKELPGRVYDFSINHLLGMSTGIV